MNFWQRIFGRKASEARIAMSINQIGQPQATPANYKNIAAKGYMANPIVFRCVSIIAEAGGGIPWLLYSGKGKNKKEIEEHPLLNLLSRPNPMQGQSAFFEAMLSYFMLDGNSYIEANAPEKNKVLELWAVRPDYMKVIPGSKGYPQAYVFDTGTAKRTWQVDFVNFKSQILHLKTFHPLNNWYGMSPIEAAMASLDQNNQINLWNLGLLKNNMQPSGVLTVGINDANPTGTLTGDEYERLKSEIYDQYVGARNSGKPMLLEGGLTWQQTAMTAKDADSGNTKSTSSREIAFVLGVPPLLVGIPGDNTYANYKEARQALYEDTVIPLLDFVRDELNNWLTPSFGPNLYLDYDRDSIEALEPKRNERRKSLSEVTYLTVNEKREADGYAPVEAGNILVMGGQIIPADEPFVSESIVLDEEVENVDDNSNPDDPDFDSDPEDDDSDEDEDLDGFASTDIADQEIKAINLVNKKERRQSWRRQNRYRKYFEDAMYLDVKEELTRLAKSLDTAANRSTPETLEFALLKAIDEEMIRLEKVLEKHIERGANGFGNFILDGGKSAFPNSYDKKANVRFTQFVSDFAKRKAATSISKIKGTTEKQVRKQVRELLVRAAEEGLTMNDLANQLQGKFTDISPGRARTIARTEMTSATQTGSLNAAKSLQIPNLEKGWVSAQDDRVRGLSEDIGPDHAVMNDQFEPIDSKFTVPPDTSMDGPGDPSADADQICNCRCVLIYQARGA